MLFDTLVEEGVLESSTPEQSVESTHPEEEGVKSLEKTSDEVSDDDTAKEKVKKGCNTAEILSVLAHELGHWKLSHNLKNIIISEVRANMHVILKYVHACAMAIQVHACAMAIQGVPLGPCPCVHVYPCVHVCPCPCVHVCPCPLSCVSLSLCVLVHVCPCVHVSMCVLVHVYLCVHLSICPCVSLSMCIYVSMCPCVSLSMSMCVHVTCVLVHVPMCALGELALHFVFVWLLHEPTRHVHKFWFPKLASYSHRTHLVPTTSLLALQ